MTFFYCRESYSCKDIKCLNISDFGVNCVEFQQKYDQTIYSLCGDQAAFMSCLGHLILEEEANAKKNYLQTLWYTLLSVITNR